MQVFICKNNEDIASAVTDEITALLREKPNAVLGLPTGSTPQSTYRMLVNRFLAGKISFKEVRTINMDEYVGLDCTHPQSFRYFMEENLFKHVNLNPENIVFFNGLAKDAAQECQRYDQLLDSLGGIDLQLAGIGSNGHVAFNEPASEFSGKSHISELTLETREANKRFFHSLSEVPVAAFTQGMGQIIAAKKIIMIATGIPKADAIYRMIYGDITPQLPASLLQKASNVSVYVDQILANRIQQQYGVHL